MKRRGFLKAVCASFCLPFLPKVQQKVSHLEALRRFNEATWQEYVRPEVITCRTNEAKQLKGSQLMSDYDIYVDYCGMQPEAAKRKIAELKVQKLQDLKKQILMQNPTLLV